MDRAGKKVRDISYHSPKNDGMVVVHSEAARAYSKYLEERCYGLEMEVHAG